MHDKEEERWNRARERGFWWYLLRATAQSAAVFIAGMIMAEWWTGQPLRPDRIVKAVVIGVVMGVGVSVINWYRNEERFRRPSSGEPRCHDCGEVTPAHTRWCPSRWSGGWAPSRESK